MTQATDATDTDTPMLFGRVLDGQGGGRAITWEDAVGWQPAKDGEVLWLHICRTRDGVQEWLERDLAVPEPTAELLTSDQTRPRAFREGNTLVGTLRGINFNPGAEPEDMISMQFWSDGHRLVTLRRHPLQIRITTVLLCGVRDCTGNRVVPTDPVRADRPTSMAKPPPKQ